MVFATILQFGPQFEISTDSIFRHAGGIIKDIFFILGILREILIIEILDLGPWSSAWKLLIY
jgi:hypothetical protein